MEFLDQERRSIDRGSYIGGPDAAAILGLSGYGTAMDVYARKIGAMTEPQESARFRNGRMLQSLVLEQWREDEAADGRTWIIQETEAFRRDESRPYLAGTADAIVNDETGQKVLLEIKTTQVPGQWESGPTDFVLTQVQHYLGLFPEIKRAKIIVWSINNPLMIFDVDRDDVFISAMWDRLSEFWKLVEERTPPEEGLSRSALSALYPGGKPEPVELSGEIINLDQRRHELSEQKKAIESELEDIDNKIKFALKDNEVGILPSGVKYTWKTVEKKEYTVKASTTRQLRRYQQKGEN